jgi:hypothetical protein
MTESFYSASSVTPSRNVRATAAAQHDSIARADKKKLRSRMFSMHVPLSLRLGVDKRDRRVAVAPGNGRSSPSPSHSSDSTLPADDQCDSPVASRASRTVYASDCETDPDERRPLDRAQSSASVASKSRRMRDWSMQACSVDRDEPFWTERRNGMLFSKLADAHLSASVCTLPRPGVVLRTLAEAEAALTLSRASVCSAALTSPTSFSQRHFGSTFLPSCLPPHF